MIISVPNVRILSLLKLGLHEFRRQLKSMGSSLKDPKNTITTFYITQQPILWYRADTSQSIST